jgi:hypothetical protein
VDIFTQGGSGVVVLPCGAGKTLVGAAAMADTKTTTLILVTNTVSARQWRDDARGRQGVDDAQANVAQELAQQARGHPRAGRQDEGGKAMSIVDWLNLGTLLCSLATVGMLVAMRRGRTP